MPIPKIPKSEVGSLYVGTSVRRCVRENSGNLGAVVPTVAKRRAGTPQVRELHGLLTHSRTDAQRHRPQTSVTRNPFFDLHSPTPTRYKWGHLAYKHALGRGGKGGSMAKSSILKRIDSDEPAR